MSKHEQIFLFLKKCCHFLTTPKSVVTLLLLLENSALFFFVSKYTFRCFLRSLTSENWKQIWLLPQHAVIEIISFQSASSDTHQILTYTEYADMMMVYILRNSTIVFNVQRKITLQVISMQTLPSKLYHVLVGCAHCYWNELVVKQWLVFLITFETKKH